MKPTRNLLAILFPLLLLVVISIFIVKRDDSASDRTGDPLLAGPVFAKSGFGSKYHRGSAKKRRTPYLFKKGSLTKIFTPSKKRAKKKAREQEIVVAKKSTVKYDFNPNARHRGWKYLSPSVRRQIDAARIPRGKWKVIVVHNSATQKGNAKAFDHYHRKVKKMPNGLAYHFVVGNGSYSGLGQIEVGHRWAGQISGGHLKSASQNARSIGICLVGDFDNDRVKKAQLEALDELVDYLHAKVGKTHVTTHRQINVVPTSCPGRYFPTRLVESAY